MVVITVLVAVSMTETVSLIDTATNTVAVTISAIGTPRGVAITPVFRIVRFLRGVEEAAVSSNVTRVVGARRWTSQAGGR